MKSVLIGCFSLCALAFGQEAVSTPTVDQIMEKSIAAGGGREAIQKMTSMAGTGTLEIVSMGVTASFEMYGKAPDKRMTVTSVEGYGDVRRGYDGKVGWSSEPQNGLVELTGDELAAAKLEAAFHGELRWKELYPKAEVTGKAKAGGRDCWLVKLTPAEGRPSTNCYDTETFLLAKADTTTAAGDVQSELSDYRDLGNGVKAPHTIKLMMPNIGEMVVRLKEIKANVEIDDAKFAKPAK